MMNRLLFVDWDAIANIPTETVWIICGTVVALAVIAAVVSVINNFFDIC
jgi:hypothetical protein